MMKKVSKAEKAKAKVYTPAKRASPGAAMMPPAGFESEANRISARIREMHMPYGTIMDPLFASPESDVVVSYTRTGDSAIWTGHYLAAEAFRYRVTRSSEALDNAAATIAGIRGLVDITGDDALARVAIPADSPYLADIRHDERGHNSFPGRLNGSEHFWIGNTTRDQYSGIMFGLGVALDMMSDTHLRGEIASLISRIVGYLVDHAWTVRMPDGKFSTTFLQRPDQQLAFAQIARKADPGRFNTCYKVLATKLSALTVLPISYDLLDDHNSYFKFNLNTINLYSLLRFESERSAARPMYLKAYNTLRRTTDDHQNAHFNMIDCAIKGPNRARDHATVEYLQEWLKRPRRDPWVDLRGQIEACGGEDRACHAIPIIQRPTTDFLWQRSPFLLFGGGVGVIEGPGIDFILPYWMGRYFGVM
jgi:hypothetical protein